MKYSDSHLRGLAPSDLLVYKNKAPFDKRNDPEGKEEPLKSSRLLDGLGQTEEDMLVVVVKATEVSNFSYTTIPEKLTQLGVEFRMRDVNYILHNDKSTLKILLLPELTKDAAHALITSVKSKIKSAT